MNRTILKAIFAMVAVTLAAFSLGAPLSLQAQKDKPSGAMPPAVIPTFSTENLGREAFFYVGGEYTGPAGKEVMHGAMYVEVMVPKQIRQKRWNRREPPAVHSENDQQTSLEPSPGLRRRQPRYRQEQRKLHHEE